MATQKVTTTKAAAAAAVALATVAAALAADCQIANGKHKLIQTG